MDEPSRAILVTGATGGIGRAVWDRLAKGGASLMLAARDAARLQSLCAALPSLGAAHHTRITVGISPAQVMGNYVSSNVIRCAWLAQAKTPAFALGNCGIHVSTLSLGGTPTSPSVEGGNQ
jgi:short-subunit dehydrogenase involved in D-alanine esterification of teichoic acids